jgi:DNA-binding CsgD family transcriptional regulator
VQLSAIDPVIGDIYDAGLTRGMWRPALEGLRGLLKSAETALVVKDASMATETTNRILSAESYDRYTKYYGRIDPKRFLFENRGPGFLFNDIEHFDDGFVAGDPFYQEFSTPLGTRHTLDYFVGRNGAQDVYLAAMRAPSQGPYDPRAVATLLRAGGHFLRAVRLRETFAETQSLAQHATAALESLSYGIAILDARARIAFANGFARRALADCRELTIRRSRLAARTGPVERELDAMLRRASREGGPASMLRLTRTDGCDLFLWCVRLPASSPLAHAQEPGVLIVLRDPQNPMPATMDDLQTLYGLTGAEALLALALGRGERLDAIAAERRVKLSTVRTQLLSILDKTGLHRQADLARLLASLATPVIGRN